MASTAKDSFRTLYDTCPPVLHYLIITNREKISYANHTPQRGLVSTKGRGPRS